MSEAVWRNRYLMDYDPLNQLLVCIVCGELQYSHSLEGVRAHIDEAHPLTLRLEPREKLRILEAWDEQVSQRERFFSSQLQQHCGSTEGTPKLLTCSSQLVANTIIIKHYIMYIYPAGINLIAAMQSLLQEVTTTLIQNLAVLQPQHLRGPRKYT